VRGCQGESRGGSSSVIESLAVLDSSAASDGQWSFCCRKIEERNEEERLRRIAKPRNS